MKRASGGGKHTVVAIDGQAVDAALAVIVPRALTGLAAAIGRSRPVRLRDNDRCMQPVTVTRADGHPRLFATIASHLAEHPAPRLLSFGCSTGEEAYSLAGYVPHGRIESVDIDAGCIATARRQARRLHLR